MLFNYLVIESCTQSVGFLANKENERETWMYWGGRELAKVMSNWLLNLHDISSRRRKSLSDGKNLRDQLMLETHEIEMDWLVCTGKQTDTAYRQIQTDTAGSEMDSLEWRDDRVPLLLYFLSLDGERIREDSKREQRFLKTRYNKKNTVKESEDQSRRVKKTSPAVQSWTSKRK